MTTIQDLGIPSVRIEPSNLTVVNLTGKPVALLVENMQFGSLYGNIGSGREQRSSRFDFVAGFHSDGELRPFTTYEPTTNLRINHANIPIDVTLRGILHGMPERIRDTYLIVDQDVVDSILQLGVRTVDDLLIPSGEVTSLTGEHVGFTRFTQELDPRPVRK